MSAIFGIILLYTAFSAFGYFDNGGYLKQAMLNTLGWFLFVGAVLGGLFLILDFFGAWR